MPDKFNNLHDLMDNLTQYLGLTPEQQFRVTAKIKRMIHVEKESVFGRYSEYAKGLSSERTKDSWLQQIMEGKAEQHRQMAVEYTDEELVTWDVGTHKFRQEKPPCADCSVSLNGAITYLSVYEKGKSTYYCKPCAIKNGKWEEFQVEWESNDKNI